MVDKKKDHQYATHISMHDLNKAYENSFCLLRKQITKKKDEQQRIYFNVLERIRLDFKSNAI